MTDGKTAGPPASAERDSAENTMTHSKIIEVMGDVLIPGSSTIQARLVISPELMARMAEAAKAAYESHLQASGMAVVAVGEIERLREILRIADTMWMGFPGARERFHKAYTDLLTDDALAHHAAKTSASPSGKALEKEKKDE